MASSKKQKKKINNQLSQKKTIRTNIRKTKNDQLAQYVKKFQNQFKLNQLDSDKQEIIPSYQSIPTSYQLKGKKKFQKKEAVKGLVGLKNLGNKCYMNASIQLLSNLQPLSDYFIEDFQLTEINRKNPISTQGLATVAFANLIKSIWQMDIQKLTVKGTPIIIPEEFNKIIGHCNKSFSDNTQQDAQEFLMYLLDMIHEDLNRVTFPIKSVQLREYSGDCNQRELEKQAAETWGDYLQRSKSIIVDLMQGQFKNSLKCLSCDNYTYKFEPLMYLSVPIPESEECQLIECIKEYVKEEQLTNGNQWFCENCHKLVDAIKKIDLWKLPTILIIHLKRFKFIENGIKKIEQAINFPLESLNLSQCLPKLQKEKPIYELLGVICHTGTSDRGHYYTYARSKENFNWYLFNDRQVKQVNFTEIPQEDAYLLMYGKSTIPLIKRQTISFPENWPHVIK
ncbi:unnamed protein product [Paramecium octaurelia]|uniref:Ubiquitin carboxyl-terminal hydrolase n=1 Tax=Paramecium octaurelia TaxID=43137 RepID=A0A8S1T8N4_PAROT|nr:unnamed protein product [Paramecium octaurelia]